MNSEIKFVFEMIRNKYLNKNFNYYSKLRLANFETPYFLAGFKSKSFIKEYPDVSFNLNLDTLLRFNCEIEKPFSKQFKLVVGINGEKMKISPHLNFEFDEN